MINGLKPYPAYKDSGVEWLGKVPEHWEVLPGRTVFREINDRGHPDEQMLSVTITRGVLRQADLLADSSKKDSSNEDKSNYKLVQPGDLVYNKMRAWQGAVGVSAYRGIVSPAYIVQRLRSAENLARYMHFLLRTPLFASEAERWSYGITSDQWSLRAEEFKCIYFSLPPLPEQIAIVRFLDYMDRRIRRSIRAKQKLIKLLEEYRKALIHRAVTGKIDVRTGQPYPAYKPSGVDWLGEVPAHWEVRRLKTLCRMKAGANITNQSIEPSGDFPVYGGNGVRGYTSDFTHEGEFILIGRQGALCGNVHLVQGRFWASEHAVVVSLYGGHDLQWFAALLEAMNLNQYSMAAAQPGLAVERVLNLWAPVPHAEEQRRIAEYITLTTSGIATAIAATRREIDLLREYRTRLISDVVTGKVDVREVAARLPEEPPEAEEAIMEDEGTNEDGEAPADAEQGAVKEEAEP